MGARIVLFGATGYTGARTAEAMVGRGLRPVLAGRDPERLAALAQRMGGLDTAVAQVTDKASVAALVGRGDVLVSTVGPFTALGAPAVQAAAEVGAVYLDSTGEPPFIREVYERWGPVAERSGAALLPAFGNDYVPGTLAGALALRAAGEGADRVDVGYFITGLGKGQPFSRGTLRSLAGTATQQLYAWRDGALRTEPAGARMRTFDVAGRPRPGVTIGACEQFALPRIAPGLRTVDVYLGWFGRASAAVHAGARVAPLLSRVPSRGMATVADVLTRRVPTDPAGAALAGARSHFVAEVFDVTGTLLARTRLTSPEPYAITADLLAWGAWRAAEHGVRGGGALDAVAAFGLDELVAGAAEARIVEEER
ncbi:saccharopine dehydrogenase NADP-binding domain-containing protein [Pseudonocardia sp. DSM 110487]|uniref:saccharopine dehydrogenase family protein n=1 Tax=Pseudonocardia sp. DSM 110487 TaxID=2865833 RepID=UPI001C694A35|nr:saccharopine dehydrogenase NADP-binding domain-containing protein [Pseudonocardia sp. DSM 110487]QYN36823.1 saccharopine dehydrogenase NADP-binding domain-containing protein [Pseudonocardia sp. DSM 110487]